MSQTSEVLFARSSISPGPKEDQGNVTTGAISRPTPVQATAVGGSPSKKIFIQFDISTAQTSHLTDSSVISIDDISLNFNILSQIGNPGITIYELTIDTTNVPSPTTPLALFNNIGITSFGSFPNGTGPHTASLNSTANTDLLASLGVVDYWGLGIQITTFSGTIDVTMRPNPDALKITVTYTLGAAKFDTLSFVSQESGIAIADFTLTTLDVLDIPTAVTANTTFEIVISSGTGTLSGTTTGTFTAGTSATVVSGLIYNVSPGISSEQGVVLQFNSTSGDTLTSTVTTSFDVISSGISSSGTTSISVNKYQIITDFLTNAQKEINKLPDNYSLAATEVLTISQNLDFDPEIDLLAPFHNAFLANQTGIVSSIPAVISAVISLQKHVMNRSRTAPTISNTSGSKFDDINQWIDAGGTNDPALYKAVGRLGDNDVSFTVSQEFADLSSQAGFPITSNNIA